MSSADRTVANGAGGSLKAAVAAAFVFAFACGAGAYAYLDARPAGQGPSMDAPDLLGVRSR